MKRRGTTLILICSALSTLAFIGSIACTTNNLPDPIAETCSEDLAAQVESLNVAAAALIDASETLKLEVAGACYEIAEDLGEDVNNLPTVSPQTTDEEIGVICTKAAKRVKDISGNIKVAIEGGYCKVDAQAQFDCEAKCDINGGCEPGTIEARCDPGELSVLCEGKCFAGAYCQGTADFRANCLGSCEGTCFGKCDNLETVENGEVCSGLCDGTCSGECYLSAETNMNCGTKVRCRGRCEANYTEPRCEGEIIPPSCDIDIDDDCYAGCEGQASFKAECSSPKISVEGHEDLKTTLEKNLPVIINALRFRGPLIIEHSADVAAAAPRVLAAANETIICKVLVAGTVAAHLQGTIDANASALATVEASIEISASVNVNVSEE